MSDDPSRNRMVDPADHIAAEDDRAAAAEEAEVERNDMAVDDATALDDVTMPATAPIAQPDALPPDGI